MIALRRKRREDDRIEVDAEAIPGVYLMSEAEGIEFFDRQARKALGISGDEFLQRWDEGMYSSLADTSDARPIRRLVMLMPLVRSTRG